MSVETVILFALDSMVMNEYTAVYNTCCVFEMDGSSIAVLSAECVGGVLDKGTLIDV